MRQERVQRLRKRVVRDHSAPDAARPARSPKDATAAPTRADALLDRIDAVLRSASPGRG